MTAWRGGGGVCHCAAAGRGRLWREPGTEPSRGGVAVNGDGSLVASVVILYNVVGRARRSATVYLGTRTRDLVRVTVQCHCAGGHTDLSV